MIISVINHTHGKIKDAKIHEVLRALNRQLAEDFEPYWSFGGTLRLEGRSASAPSKQGLTDMRGDAVIYLWDGKDPDGALGYHEKNNRGIPFGFVFLEISKELDESWTVTLSHEALELVGDPEANLLVMGPHPKKPKHTVFHWFEMCDAVQDETYEIDGIEVSNFVLPLYFTEGNEAGSRNDFLGTENKGKTLRSFGVNAGGYIGFYDPAMNDHDTFAIEGDAKAARRLAIKGKARGARRAAQYRTGGARRTLAQAVARAGRPGRA